MSVRLLVASLGFTVLAAACQSSGRYGTPAYAGAAVGVAAAGAVVNRAAGGCWAECLPGSHCNHATGLCERGEAPPTSATPIATTEHAGRGAPVVHTGASYPPGHEYEIPPMSTVDAGCSPASSGDGDAGVIACEMDGSTL